MAIKLDELSNPTSCLNKAEPDEPLFVLRANDELAPVVVEFWAHHRRNQRNVLDPKAAEAMDCAERMREWKRQQIDHGFALVPIQVDSGMAPKTVAVVSIEDTGPRQTLDLALESGRLVHIEPDGSWRFGDALASDTKRAE